MIALTRPGYASRQTSQGLPKLARILVCSVLGLCLGACSSSTPETRYYLLTNAMQPPTALERTCPVRIANVTLAPYLQRNNIIVQTAANELVPALQHRWSEPMQAGVARLMQRCINASADASASLTLTIDHLHGGESGVVVLQGQWQIIDGDNTKTERFDRRTNQSRDGYDALVKAQAQLLTELCQQVRSSHCPN